MHLALNSCGETGIRTPGPVKVNSFQDCRIRPLCHLSIPFRDCKYRYFLFLTKIFLHLLVKTYHFVSFFSSSAAKKRQWKSMR